jgi:hypothetical protein
MAELTEKDKAYLATVDSNTPYGTTLVVGWPDEEYGIDHGGYRLWAENVVANVEEDYDMPALMSFENWKTCQRENDPDRDEFGFMHQNCDLCNALPGDRHAATALYADGTYEALRICGDCLQYIANGELPQE